MAVPGSGILFSFPPPQKKKKKRIDAGGTTGSQIDNYVSFMVQHTGHWH